MHTAPENEAFPPVKKELKKVTFLPDLTVHTVTKNHEIDFNGIGLRRFPINTVCYKKSLTHNVTQKMVRYTMIVM